MTCQRHTGVRLLWDTYAYLYDGLLDVLTYRDMIDTVVALTDGTGRTVLDVGAGTGNVTRGLVAAGAARVIAVDLSATMLGRARRKLDTEVAGGTVRLVLDDAVSAMAALPEQSVERITAVNVLYALDDRREFFRQVRRVLAPGGFVIAAHTIRPGSGPVVRDQLRRGGLRACLRPRLIGIAVIDLVIDLLALRGRFDFAPVRTLAEEAAAEGLPATISLGRCYPGPDGVNELVRISGPDVAP